VKANADNAMFAKKMYFRFFIKVISHFKRVVPQYKT
jgi:hypothetical protein